jgi:hypothetical protein
MHKYGIPETWTERLILWNNYNNKAPGRYENLILSCYTNDNNNIRTECGKIKKQNCGLLGMYWGDNVYNNIMFINTNNCCDTLNEVTHAREDGKRKVHLYIIIPALRATLVNILYFWNAYVCIQSDRFNNELHYCRLYIYIYYLVVIIIILWTFKQMFLEQT